MSGEGILPNDPDRDQAHEWGSLHWPDGRVEPLTGPLDRDSGIRVTRLEAVSISNCSIMRGVILPDQSDD